MSHIDDLKTVIHKLHGATATHRESVSVTEVWPGQINWDGVVEVFDLEGHPNANKAYALVTRNGRPEKPKTAHNRASYSTSHIASYGRADCYCGEVRSAHTQS